MNISRRTFLNKGAIALVGTAVIPGFLFASAKHRDKLGIQLWTVRNDMKENPLSTLEQLSKIGYKYVEHANYVDRKFYGYSAKGFKKILDDLGLKMFSGHVQMNLDVWNKTKNGFTDEWKHTIEDAVAAGQQYLITPELDEAFQKDYERLMQLLDLFNKCGALCKKSGLKFGYHNDFSFDSLLNNERLYDIILKNTDPALVTQELDIGNMYGELQNEKRAVLDLLKENSRIFPLMHVKDERKINSKGEMNNGFQSTVLGKGEVPVKEIIDYGRNHSGTTYFIVEQESYQEYTPLACAKKDYAVMKTWGY